MKASIVIRTYNEERHLSDVLRSITNQQADGVKYETLIIDSGSTDRTLDVAKEHSCRIFNISKEEFSFGRSLNLGCEAADGDLLVFVSGHCVPVHPKWLVQLLRPLRDGATSYVYGRQIGNGASRFSERQLFKKYFPDISSVPQQGFFCNNANAAILRDVWQKYRFDDELTGLEDMDLAKRLTAAGSKIGYVAEAAVYHLHDETWLQVRTRYEREALALQQIMPQVHVSFLDFMRYFVSGVLLDSGSALQERVLMKTIPEILMFRLMQFWGAYRGNHEHRKLSREMKEEYFYPRANG
jgi:glycosyltransferase involved in cell wall biosynthesis